MLEIQLYLNFNSTSIYLYKYNIGNARKVYEICSKLIIKTTTEWRHYGIFIANLNNVHIPLPHASLWTSKHLLGKILRFCASTEQMLNHFLGQLLMLHVEITLSPNASWPILFIIYNAEKN